MAIETVFLKTSQVYSAQVHIHGRAELLPDPARILRHFRDNLNRRPLLESDCLRRLLQETLKLLSSEPNVKYVNGPSIIIGDVHGQFEDFANLLNQINYTKKSDNFRRHKRPCTLSMEKVEDNVHTRHHCSTPLSTWKIADYSDPTKFLFLGDYVNRASRGVEIWIVLMALKIRFPHKVVLLRGNHESRRLAFTYNFAREFQFKYGTADLALLFRTFDALPRATVLDSKFFCVHGGISPDFETVEDIQSHFRMSEPKKSGPLTDMLWSDPENSNNALAGGEGGDYENFLRRDRVALELSNGTPNTQSVKFKPVVLADGTILQGPAAIAFAKTYEHINQKITNENITIKRNNSQKSYFANYFSRSGYIDHGRNVNNSIKSDLKSGNKSQNLEKNPDILSSSPGKSVAIASDTIITDVPWTVLNTPVEFKTDSGDLKGLFYPACTKSQAPKWTMNTSRHCSYYYSTDAADNFLSKNGFLSIIRGHEPQVRGVNVHSRGSSTQFPTAITVFSAPNYCGMNNNGATLSIQSNHTITMELMESFSTRNTLFKYTITPKKQVIKQLPKSRRSVYSRLTNECSLDEEMMNSKNEKSFLYKYNEPIKQSSSKKLKEQRNESLRIDNSTEKESLNRDKTISDSGSLSDVESESRKIKESVTSVSIKLKQVKKTDDISNSERNLMRDKNKGIDKKELLRKYKELEEEKNKIKGKNRYRSFSVDTNRLSRVDIYTGSQMANKREIKRSNGDDSVSSSASTISDEPKMTNSNGADNLHELVNLDKNKKAAYRLSKQVRSKSNSAFSREDLPKNRLSRTSKVHRDSIEKLLDHSGKQSLKDSKDWCIDGSLIQGSPEFVIDNIKSRQICPVINFQTVLIVSLKTIAKTNYGNIMNTNSYPFITPCSWSFIIRREYFYIDSNIKLALPEGIPRVVSNYRTPYSSRQPSLVSNSNKFTTS